MTRRILGCMALAVLFCTPCFAAVGQQVEPEKSDVLPREIPFEIVNGHLIEVRGSIGTHTKLRFLVDVGTPQTMLDTELGRREKDAEHQDKAKVPATVQHSEILLREFSLG